MARRRGSFPEVLAARDRAIRAHLDSRRREPTAGELARWIVVNYDLGASQAKVLAARHLTAWQSLPTADRLSISKARAVVGVLGVGEAAHGC